VQLRDDRERFERAGAAISLIALGPYTRAQLFCDERHVPFECLSDPSQEAYRAFGLERGSNRQLFGPQLLLRYARALLRRDVEAAGLSGDDYRQMPGVFVIDRTGVIRYAHRNADVADNPPNDEVLEALTSLHRRTGPSRGTLPTTSDMRGPAQ
jgi:peroxiredoxin